MKAAKHLKTWVEIDKKAARHNVRVFRSLLGRRTKLFAVVKSNAYGHGLVVFSKLVDALGVDGFCVDSVVEGMRLREEGIQKPILVLGFSMPFYFSEAAARDVTVTISSFEQLRLLAKAKKKPRFHMKIDTGLHRRGIYSSEAPRAARFVKKHALPITGIYTHFASAKDVNCQTVTDRQFAAFQRAAAAFEKAGFKNLMRHAAATSGTLAGRRYHLDAVRVGIGLYGLWPSKELEIQLGNRAQLGRHIALKAVLSWRTIISEVKPLSKGDYVGYDLTYRAPRATKIAVLPIGYWHALSRAFSNNGFVLIGGKRAPIIGRVSMDIAVADVGGIKCKAGDIATLIGRSGKEELSAGELARRTGTIHYEIITRLNPQMERVAM